ncbi:MAG: response regulator [Cyanobium sp.]
MTSTADPALRARGRVAVVDDDPRIRTLLEDELLDQGLSPALCAGPGELLELLRTQPIDLVLMDVVMPEMSGMDCLLQLRQIDYRGAVVMVTAIDDETIRTSCLENGARDYVLKNELFDRLNELLSTHLPPAGGNA